jgi:hypothetical protein
MAIAQRSMTFHLFRLGLIFCIALALAGCKKSGSGDSGVEGDMVVLAVPTFDIKPDGTIGDKGMEKISEHSNDRKLFVVFVRAPLTDAGLAQLSKFPNIKKVEAIGSRVSDKGVQQLKSALPEVEVVK